MGQYWIPVNLDKKEYIHPHKLGTGLKLWEQLANHPGTGGALIILTAAMPERRGGGDLDPNETVGRWAGDRIAIVGDYAENSDLPPDHHAALIYGLCGTTPEGILEWIESLKKRIGESDNQDRIKEYEEHIAVLKESEPYTDITDDVCAVIERELDGKYTGTGWRNFEYKEETPS